MRLGKYMIMIVLLMLLACGERPKQVVGTPPKEEMKSSMEKANRYLLNEEAQEINNYVTRHGLNMEATGSGLRYQIIRQGNGPTIEKGQQVVLDYELHSITGELLYSSEKDGVKAFKVGDGSVESGLDEAMTHLHYGDVAKLIIPYHLGYGLHGDDNRIPECATLIYSIKINKQ